MTTATNGTAAKDAKAKGWGALPCPCCGEARATVTLDLAGLDLFHCQDCDADFDAASVRAFIERWGKVLRWIDAVQEGGLS
jgi:hypothetical protein